MSNTNKKPNSNKTISIKSLKTHKTHKSFAWLIKAANEIEDHYTSAFYYLAAEKKAGDNLVLKMESVLGFVERIKKLPNIEDVIGIFRQQAVEALKTSEKSILFHETHAALLESIDMLENPDRIIQEHEETIDHANLGADLISTAITEMLAVAEKRNTTPTERFDSSSVDADRLTIGSLDHKQAILQMIKHGLEIEDPKVKIEKLRYPIYIAQTHYPKLYETNVNSVISAIDDHPDIKTKLEIWCEIIASYNKKESPSKNIMLNKLLNVCEQHDDKIISCRYACFVADHATNSSVESNANRVWGESIRLLTYPSKQIDECIYVATGKGHSPEIYQAVVVKMANIIHFTKPLSKAINLARKAADSAKNLSAFQVRAGEKLVELIEMNYRNDEILNKFIFEARLPSFESYSHKVLTRVFIKRLYKDKKTPEERFPYLVLATKAHVTANYLKQTSITSLMNDINEEHKTPQDRIDPLISLFKREKLSSELSDNIIAGIEINILQLPTNRAQIKAYQNAHKKSLEGSPLHKYLSMRLIDLCVVPTKPVSAIGGKSPALIISSVQLNNKLAF